MAEFHFRLREAMAAAGISQSELCERTNIPKSAISQYLSGAFKPKQDRTYLLAQALGVSAAWLMGYDAPAPEKKAGRGVKIPVLGTVAAGIPIEAVEDILDYEEIEPELAATGEFFALQIKGDSMEPRMQSGDVVIVRQQPDVESGDVAVVLINGDEATVKKLLKQSGGIVLQAFNPAYEPMFFSPQDIEEKPVRVIGKVIELRGKF